MGYPAIFIDLRAFDINVWIQSTISANGTPSKTSTLLTEASELPLLSPDEIPLETVESPLEEPAVEIPAEVIAQTPLETEG